MLKFYAWIVLLSTLTACSEQKTTEINLWYGHEQYFGTPGNTQKYINILGNVSPGHSVRSAEYTVNGNGPFDFMIGSDLHRLAKPGDFNIEFDRNLLVSGTNELLITVTGSTGNKVSERVIVHYSDTSRWPLPYAIKWDTIDNIQKVAQVLDGKWQLTAQGVRIHEPYYDRTLAFGDDSWQDYEVKAEVIFHSYTEPYPGAPNYNVTHAAIASRWPGFDPDAYQPFRKWYPLGATCEFRFLGNADSCCFRILGGGNITNMKPRKVHKIRIGEMYYMKTRCLSLGSDSALFSARLWHSSDEEPEDWDIDLIKYPEEIKTGCALVIAHHTELTFGTIEAKRISPHVNYKEKISP